MPKQQDVLERLAILERNLEQEGAYVRQNTVWLAMEEIRRLRMAVKVIAEQAISFGEEG
jgi:hypothetical protein